MATKVPSHEERFHLNVIDLSNLIHELISLCYEKGYTDLNPNIVKLASNIVERLDKNRLLENFIQYTNEYWEQISKRDSEFFMENANKVFCDLPIDKVNAFQVLFTARDNNGQPIIGKDDEDAIWDYFDSLIRICIKYIYEKREPFFKDGVETYKNKYYKDIPLKKYAKHWKVDLNF